MVTRSRACRRRVGNWPHPLGLLSAVACPVTARTRQTAAVASLRAVRLTGGLRGCGHGSETVTVSADENTDRPGGYGSALQQYDF